MTKCLLKFPNVSDRWPPENPIPGRRAIGHMVENRSIVAQLTQPLLTLSLLSWTDGRPAVLLSLDAKPAGLHSAVASSPLASREGVRGTQARPVLAQPWGLELDAGRVG